MRWSVLTCALLIACSRDGTPTDAPAQRASGAPALAAIGNTPHEAVLASEFLGAFDAPNGDALELRGDGTYGARFGPQHGEGAWYAFGAHLELRPDARDSSALGFDLVAADSQRFLVPEGRLAKFVVDASRGAFSPAWLRRPAEPGDVLPGLPSPFDTIARLREPANDAAAWRGSFRAASLEMFESLDVDEHGRFEYASNGCWATPESAIGTAGVFGDLVRLSCDVAGSAPNFAEQALFAPLRHGARRYLVPCDDMWRFANANRWSPAARDTLYMHDGADFGSGEWSAPRAFGDWLAETPVAADVVRVGLAGPAARRTTVVTLDAGQTRGVYRGQWFSEVADRSNELRVVVVRESECDAVPLDPANDGRLQTVGTSFDSHVH